MLHCAMKDGYFRLLLLHRTELWNSQLASKLGIFELVWSSMQYETYPTWTTSWFDTTPSGYLYWCYVLLYGYCESVRGGPGLHQNSNLFPEWPWFVAKKRLLWAQAHSLLHLDDFYNLWQASLLYTRFNRRLSPPFHFIEKQRMKGCTVLRAIY